MTDILRKDIITRNITEVEQSNISLLEYSILTIVIDNTRFFKSEKGLE